MLCFFMLSGCTITNQNNGNTGNGSGDDEIGNPPLPGDDLGDDGDSPPVLPI